MITIVKVRVVDDVTTAYGRIEVMVHVISTLKYIGL